MADDAGGGAAAHGKIALFLFYFFSREKIKTLEY